MKTAFAARIAFRAFSLCLLAGFAGAGASDGASLAIANGVDVRRVTDAALADAMAASKAKGQSVVCGSSTQTTVGSIARRRGRFRCVA